MGIIKMEQRLREVCFLIAIQMSLFHFGGKDCEVAVFFDCFECVFASQEKY